MSVSDDCDDMDVLPAVLWVMNASRRYRGSSPTLFLLTSSIAMTSVLLFEPVTLCYCWVGSGNNDGCLLTELVMIPLKAVWCSYSSKLSAGTVIYCNSSTASTQSNQTTTDLVSTRYKSSLYSYNNTMFICFNMIKY